MDKVKKALSGQWCGTCAMEDQARSELAAMLFCDVMNELLGGIRNMLELVGVMIGWRLLAAGPAATVHEVMRPIHEPILWLLVLGITLAWRLRPAFLRAESDSDVIYTPSRSALLKQGVPIRPKTTRGTPAQPLADVIPLKKSTPETPQKD